MYCKNCGNLIDNNSIFCPECGINLIGPSTKTNITTKQINYIDVTFAKTTNLLNILVLIFAFVAIFLAAYGNEIFIFGFHYYGKIINFVAIAISLLILIISIIIIAKSTKAKKQNMYKANVKLICGIITLVLSSILFLVISIIMLSYFFEFDYRSYYEFLI